MALKYAVKIDLIPTNPADKVDLPRIEKYQATFYDKDDTICSKVISEYSGLK